MDMLRITNLKKHFGDKEVLTGLNLSVPEHSVFGFVGENGAGKTTTMKIILGLLKSDRGEVFVSGERVKYGQTAIMIRPHGAVLPTRMGIVEILMELSKAVCLLVKNNTQ